ncbi:MAG TPA: hypothetical protein VF142_01535 [Longimicrobium sp.]
MSESPPLWGRVFAWVQGEVSTETLEAYRRASAPVFELMERVEGHRQASVIDGLTPWTLPPATRAELLCAWNAFVLQTLGNDIMDADSAEHPPTAGYVPPVTAQQVMAFFTEVEGWVDRARQAQANPDDALDVPVPALLPAWCEADPCPPSHLRGLLQAMRAVGEHAAAALAALPQTAADPEQRRQLNRIRQLYASAQGKARYATDMHGHDPPPDVQERAEPYARQAVEMFYELGQLIADPTLVGGAAAPAPPVIAPPAREPAPRTPTPTSAPRATPTPLLPGDPAFDPWCLTDPGERRRREEDPVAASALRHLWKADPDPARTLAIHAEIQEAMAAGRVAYAEEGARPGHAHRCPWGPVYVARDVLVLGGVPLLAGQAFVYEVRAAGRGGLIRRIRPRPLRR